MNWLYKYKKILFIIVILLAVAALVQAENVTRFVYFDQFETFSWVENGQMRGIFIDAVNEVFMEKLEIDVKHEGFPWKRAQQMVETGKADGMCTISTYERLTYTHSIKYPIIETEFKIFTAANNRKLEQLSHVNKISELKGFALIDILGSGWAQTYLSNLGVHYEKIYDRVLMLLAKERYDAAIRNSIQTNYLINKLGYQGVIIELPQPMMTRPQSYRILINKNSVYAEHLDEINNILERMHEDGTLLQILNKYL